MGPVGLPALPLGLGAPVQLDGLEGEGQPSTMGSGRRTATVEVARAPTWSASHREAPSRAVKCLKTTPGWGRASRGVTLHQVARAGRPRRLGEPSAYPTPGRNSSSTSTTLGASPWSTTYWAMASSAGRLDSTP